MAKTHPLSPDGDRFPAASPGTGGETTPPARVVTTRDHDAIRRWAARHHADPATGEATASGPATVSVNDGGAGIRFNFPAAARYRPISWDEWFEHFDAHHLTFVCEEEIDPPDGTAAAFPSDPPVRASSTRPVRYRLIKDEDELR